MKKFFGFALLSFCLLFLAAPSHGAQFFEPWADIWANSALYETNTERNDFKSIVSRIDAKIGVNLFPLWGDSWIMPYVSYAGVSSQDPAYWNNSGATGLGARMKPFARYFPAGWSDEWIKDLRIFGEVLNITYYSESEKAEAEEKPMTDTRFGLELWHEWNQFDPANPGKKVDPSLPWAEVWASLSQRTTNFYEEDFNISIFYWQQKIGVQSDIADTGMALEPYLKFDLVISSKDEDKHGTKLSWLNHFDYGAGIRLRPFKQGQVFGNNAPWLSKLKIFAEIVSISWIKGKDKDDRPDTDFRFGMDFTLGR